MGLQFLSGSMAFVWLGHHSILGLWIVLSCISPVSCDTLIISPEFSCISYSNKTCIPRQSLLSSKAGQSQYLTLNPKAAGGMDCDATCANALPVSASIGGVNGTYRYDSGMIILEWKDPNTYKVSGITSLRAFVGTEEVSNSPLSILMSPGPESLDNLVVYGSGSTGGTVGSNISL